MNLIAPLGLALGLTLPVVVVFYLLKVRRHDEEVSSTFLWNDLLRDLAAHEPLQKLRWNVLLVLQLLVLALATAALARPALEQIGEKPVHAVLVVDGSASMQAADVSPSRFAQAIDGARRTVAGLPDNSVATVILATAHPQVLVAATADRRQADQALANARPSGSAGDMREALLLARSLGGDPSARRIYLFTDNAFTLPPDLPDDLGAVSVTQTAGTDAGNVAITAVATRPDPRDNRRQQLFTRVENFADKAASTTLTLSVDDQVVEQRPLNLDPNGKQEQVFEDLPTDGKAATVSLSGTDGTNALGLDDNAYAILEQRKPAQVLLVTAGNPFLEKALSLLPNLDLYRIDARRYLAVEADKFDVVVFDSYLPPLLPRGNLLVINPPDRGPVQTNGVVPRSGAATWEGDDPLLSYVDVRGLTVNRARHLDLPNWSRSLINASDGSSLLAVGQDGSRRMAILPFDLNQSNLPRSQAFPILMANVISYLSPPGVVEQPAIKTGDAETIVPLPQVEQVQVTGPAGQPTALKTGSGPLTYAATDVPGLYHVQQLVANGGQTLDENVFAANLADPQESDLRPRAQDLAGASPIEATLVPLQKETWPYLAALGLPLLLAEWWWFQRRV